MPLWCKICRFSRQKNKKITNWQLEHQRYIDEWMLMEQNNMGIHAVHHDKAFDDYLVWLGQRTRLQLRPAWRSKTLLTLRARMRATTHMTKLPEKAGKLRSPLR